MERYRKLLVAVVGLAAMFVPELAGFDDDAGEVFDVVLAVLTAFGVYQVKNAPPGPEPGEEPHFPA